MGFSEGLTSGLVVLAVVFGFGYLILARLNKRGSNLFKKAKDWFFGKDKEEEIAQQDLIREELQQTWPQKRSML